MRDGLVNGAEYFAINNPEKVKLWGIESSKLYLDNLKVYRDSLAYKDEVERALKKVSRILSNLKVKIYSRGLLGLGMNYTAYKAGNLEFKEYLAYLIAEAKKAGIALDEFRNIESKPKVPSGFATSHGDHGIEHLRAHVFR